MGTKNDVAVDADAEQASHEVELALREGRYDEVLAIADAAIAELLHDGLTVDNFVRLALRGAPLESLMRVERRAVLRFRHLHEPIALRWEALRRSGRRTEAREMRLLCVRHFPERASVWATAGNQALDEQNFDEAQACFERCLRCNSRWTAGLAGLAIVLEARKDWARALEYRRCVVEFTGALERDDPPSLQRVIRYAAGLCRTERWSEAGILLRRCVALGAFESLPAERPVLLRVFARELYSPAMIATLCLSAPPPPDTPEITLALHEARVLAGIMRGLQVQAELDPRTRRKWLGMCAWLAGDEARAYRSLDEAEVDAPDDLAIQCLLAWSAAVLGAPDLSNIERFALAAARACVERASAELVPEDDLFYALVTFKRLGGRDGARACAGQGELVALYSEACATPSSAPVPPLSATAGDDWAERFSRVIAFRAAYRAAGHPALEVALASAEALAALLPVNP